MEQVKEISDEKWVSETKLKSTIVVKNSKVEKLQKELYCIRESHAEELSNLREEHFQGYT